MSTLDSQRAGLEALPRGLHRRGAVISVGRWQRVMVAVARLRRRWALGGTVSGRALAEVLEARRWRQ